MSASVPAGELWQDVAIRPEERTVGIAVTEEHAALAETVRRWCTDRCPPSVPRAYHDDPDRGLPELWEELAAQGWTGLAVPEQHGGLGAGLLETACVLEELGRALVPGPYLPTVLAAALIGRYGTEELRGRLLGALAAGDRIGAVALEPASVHITRGGGVLRLRGTVEVLPAGEWADVVVVGGVEGPDEHEVWVAVELPRGTATRRPSLDPTRPVARLDLDGVEVPEAQELAGCSTAVVQALARVLLAAEACGVAGWCLDTAAEYAKVREQFGRPIGQFQAVKHRCADMLVRTEQARALAWDAARAADDPEAGPQAGLAAALAAAVAVEAAFRNAEDCIQILGGIGFTWEHDAHMYLKRATAVRQLLRVPLAPRADAAELALSGVRRRLDVELPPEAEAYRREVRAFLAEIADLDEEERRRRMADAGYLTPELPRPWGREADAVEQLVIDTEFRAAGVTRPSLQIGQWVVPTLIAYGTPEQQERFIPPTLYGEIVWCQLFSEPGAGSDLASLQTKAVRVDGGWRLTGQKVWTSLAHRADYAICLARTDPDAPKHEGITYFIVDMHSDGIEVRPLRELTGEAMFNEVFLTDVFVPDDQVVGQVNAGWQVARNTLAHERVAMAGGSSFGGSLEAVLALLQQRPERDDPRVLDQLGRLLGDGLSVALLGFRTTLHQLAGSDPGPASSVRKLLGVEHDQRSAEFALSLLGPAGTILEGDGARWARAYLLNRCLTIAGGTSEIQRNVIAERILGLPRDPEPPEQHSRRR